MAANLLTLHFWLQWGHLQVYNKSYPKKISAVEKGKAKNM